MKFEQRPVNITAIVEWFDPGFTSWTFLVQVSRIFSLDFGRVAEHDGSKCPGCWCAINRSAKALFDEIR